MNKGRYKSMVCLVGENPLPIYLSIKQFAEKGAIVVLVHSAQTKEQAESVEKMVETMVQVRFELLVDPFAPIPTEAVMENLAKQYPDAILNYTGGTKVMSAHGLMNWAARRDCVVYLDESKRLFRFGDGVDVPLVGSLTIVDLCTLHGVAPVISIPMPPCDFQDLKNILDKFASLQELREIKNPALIPPWIHNNYQEWEKWLNLLSPHTKRMWQQHTQERFQYDFFAKHQWLEELVRRLMLGLETTGDRLSIAPPPTQPLLKEDQIRRGTYFKIQGQQFESDIMTVSNQTLRYISITKSTADKYVKGKAFEAMHRAAQIGGDMARSCVVCLATKKTIANCQLSVNNARHDLFGTDDITEWIGGNGRNLRQFLTR